MLAKTFLYLFSLSSCDIPVARQPDAVDNGLQWSDTEHDTFRVCYNDLRKPLIWIF